MRIFIAMVTLLVLTGCSNEQIFGKNKEGMLVYETSATNGMYGDMVYKICVDGHIYYKYKKGLAINLDDNGKPLKCSMKVEK